MNAAFYAVQDFLQLLTMIVLVRILVPENYAIYALVIATHGLVGAFGHQSFIAHSLQVDVKSKIDYDVHMTFSGFIQLFCFCLCNIIAYFYKGSGDLQGISIFLHVLSLTFIIEWFSELIFKIYERNESWKRRRLLQLISSFATSILSIFLALNGFGVWALVIPFTLQNLIFLYDLFFYHRWKFYINLNWEKYKSAWIFGWYRIGSLILQRGRVWIEPWLLIQFILLADLGNFSRALGLGQLLIYRIFVTAMLTIFPYISKLRDSEKKVSERNNRLITYLFLVLIPITIGLFFYSPFVTALLYGDQWFKVADMLKPLAFICFFQGLIHVLSQLTLSEQNFRIPVWIDSALLFIHSLPIFFGDLFSINFYLKFILISYALCALIVLQILDTNLKILNLKKILKTSLKILFCCLPIFIFMYFNEISFSVTIKSFIEILVLIYLYLVFVRLLFDKELSELINLASKFIVFRTMFFIKINYDKKI